jgi:hypothetical protein
LCSARPWSPAGNRRNRATMERADTRSLLPAPRSAHR